MGRQMGISRSPILFAILLAGCCFFLVAHSARLAVKSVDREKKKVKLVAYIGDQQFNITTELFDGGSRRVVDPNETSPRGVRLEVAFTDDTETPPKDRGVLLEFTFHDDIEVPLALRNVSPVELAIDSDENDILILKTVDFRTGNWLRLIIGNGRVRLTPGNIYRTPQQVEQLAAKGTDKKRYGIHVNKFRLGTMNAEDDEEAVNHHSEL